MLKKKGKFFKRFLWLTMILILLTGSAVQAMPEPQLVPGETAESELAPLNPDFERFMERLEEGEPVFTSEEGRPLGYVPPPADLSHLAEAPEDYSHLLNVLPARFDLRDEGRTTPVKDQQIDGPCWAFATYASLESHLRPAENLIFSENHLKNTHGFDNRVADGGNATMSTAYLSRWSGPVLESQDPYNPNSDQSPGGLQPQKHLQQVKMLPEDPAVIKQAVHEGGMVFTSMHWDGGAYNEATNAFYYRGGQPPNHGVAIAGWDDNYSLNNFTPAPPGNGAWIIKNSWGTGMHDNGYFYMSYHDTHSGNDVFAFHSAEATNNYRDNYQYDELGMTSWRGYNSDEAWGANIFSAQADASLEAVGLYARAHNTTVEIGIFTGVTPGQPMSGTLQESKTTTIEWAGYHTISLDQAVALTGGQNFSVVVVFNTPGDNFPIPIEGRLPNYSSGASANPGESFISANGQHWTDISFSNSENVCIKAFTTDGTAPDPDPDPGPGPGPDPDGETGRISGEDRFETAAEVSREGWPNGSNTVLIANGFNFPDALAGVPLANHLDAPVLLTGSDTLNNITRTEVQRLGANRAIILGGNAVVTPAVEASINSIVPQVDRLGGIDRFDTAKRIAEELAKTTNFNRAFIADGFNFPDALAAASYAAGEGSPILLARTDALPDYTRNAINSLGITATTVVGGTAAISDAVAGQLPGATRISGQDRYETALDLAREYLSAEAQEVYIATGENFPDALAGSVLAARNESGLLLVPGGQSDLRKNVGLTSADEPDMAEHAYLDSRIKGFLEERGFRKVTIFGGPGAVIYNIEAEIEESVTGVKPHTINVFTGLAGGGTVSGGGNYKHGGSVTVRATADSDYNFKNWTEGGSVVSNSATYSFNATGSRNLVANFEKIAQTPAAPKLLHPANNATVYGLQTTLEWQHVPGATNYRIETVKVEDASETSSLEGYGNLVYFHPLPQDGSSYQWRVRAQNEHGWGPWSETRTFTSR